MRGVYKPWLDRHVEKTNLTEFLLARIAGDIADAREVQALAVTRGLQPDDPREPALRVARRVLAECAAKRRIVEMQGKNDELRYQPGFHYKAQVIETVLRLLAQPYADHPDFREEWRVA